MATGINTAKTKLEINTSGSTYVQVKGFTDFSGMGGGSAAVIDTTDFDSDAKEKAMGLPDEGQVSVSLIFLPKDAGQAAMRAARNTRAATKFRVTLSDGTKYEFTAYVLTFERGGNQDEVVKATSNLEVTGAMTETVAAGV
ncbi:Phage tail tube protein [Sphingomonas gellani]|uniref:Phage tail tube protein n=1 Tax=Sphingomonas gellani TaxID=1166340 RepID=A0A1H7Y5K4_9SPHN|nr:phage tail tube protein [Sphingomonas gellani]SEM40617.1 Phage tail tube protein [Sphingomonas gellani]